MLKNSQKIILNENLNKLISKFIKHFTNFSLVENYNNIIEIINISANSKIEKIKELEFNKTTYFATNLHKLLATSQIAGKPVNPDESRAFIERILPKYLEIIDKVGKDLSSNNFIEREDQYEFLDHHLKNTKIAIEARINDHKLNSIETILQSNPTNFPADIGKIVTDYLPLSVELKQPKWEENVKKEKQQLLLTKDSPQETSHKKGCCIIL